MKNMLADNTLNREIGIHDFIESPIKMLKISVKRKPETPPKKTGNGLFLEARMIVANWVLSPISARDTRIKE